MVANAWVATGDGCRKRDDYRGHRMRIAIDGPAGAGQSTVARAVADALGWEYLRLGGRCTSAAALKGQARRHGHPLRGRPRACRRRRRDRRDPHARRWTEWPLPLPRDPEKHQGSSSTSSAPWSRAGDWVIEGRDDGDRASRPDAEVKSS